MKHSPDAMTEMKRYRGTNPIPDDFEDFWKERMSEADREPLKAKLVPSDVIPPCPTSRAFDLWFRGMGAAKLYAKVFMPTEKLAGPGPWPMVMRFHGYPGRTRSWLENASWVGMGCILVSMDNPGQGGRSEDIGGFTGTTVAGHPILGLDGDPKNLYYVRLYQDIRILFRTIAASEALNHSKTYIYGDSQGGGVGIATCALNPKAIDKAGILYPFLSDFQEVFELDADIVAYDSLRYYSRWFDATGAHEQENFYKLGYIDTLSFAHLVACPVLFGTGLADTVCPPITQFGVYNNLTCPKKHLLYPDYGHEEIQAFDDELLSFFQEANNDE